MDETVRAIIDTIGADMLKALPERAADPEIAAWVANPFVPAIRGQRLAFRPRGDELHLERKLAGDVLRRLRDGSTFGVTDGEPLRFRTRFDVFREVGDSLFELVG